MKNLIVGTALTIALVLAGPATAENKKAPANESPTTTVVASVEKQPAPEPPVTKKKDKQEKKDWYERYFKTPGLELKGF